MPETTSTTPVTSATSSPSIAPHHWLGLCLVTESNRPSEWPYIAWVVRNRLDSHRFRHTYEAVILQPSQFSAFNKWTASPSSVDPLLVFRHMVRGYTWVEQIFHAGDIALQVINADRKTSAPFPITVCHYWSPVSMRPLGRKPTWADSAKRLFTPDGIDPNRFIFADGVA